MYHVHSTFSRKHFLNLFQAFAKNPCCDWCFCFFLIRCCPVPSPPVGLHLFLTPTLLCLTFLFPLLLPNCCLVFPVSQSQQPCSAFPCVSADQQAAGQYGGECPDRRRPVWPHPPSHAGPSHWQVPQCEDSGCSGHDASTTAQGFRLSNYQWCVFLSLLDLFLIWYNTLQHMQNIVFNSHF